LVRLNEMNSYIEQLYKDRYERIENIAEFE